MADKNYVISKALIEDGMIIQFLYKKVNGQRKSYTVTVVDKGFDGKMHALSASEINPGQLGPSLGVMSSKRMKEARGLDIPVIQNIQNAGITQGYRTFILQNMDKISVIKWPFPANVWDVSTPVDIPKTAIEGQKTMDLIQTGNEEAMNQPDDIIVQKIKQKLQQDFIEGENNED
tara:strand:+ start:40 stop:564 length:525 start_codon:yes stop_codon:yes gene_type:complete